MMASSSSKRTLDQWVVGGSIEFSLDSTEKFNAALDTVVRSMGQAVEVLGFGEGLHGGEDILMLRNRMFQRLVEAHGFVAIAIETTFPQARLVNDYVCGRSEAAADTVKDWFSNGFGLLEANRELVEWIRDYNTRVGDGGRQVEFHGFDMPLGKTGFASPRMVLNFVFDYLASVDGRAHDERRQRVEGSIGEDFAWENPAAIMDATKAVGLSPAATSLRIEVEDLVAVLRRRYPELAANTGERRYAEALHYGCVARQLLTAHSALARKGGYPELLGIRDTIMADNVLEILAQVRGRGRLMLFAHNGHLKRGQMEWRMGADVHKWWPAGAHLDRTLGDRFAVIGSTVGVSEENGIGQPEAGTFEARLAVGPEAMRFIPTHKGLGILAEEIANVPIRTGSVKNPTYFPLTAQSFTDFEWLAIVNSTTYQRGGPPLQAWDTGSK
jgi:erythromycin esterase